MLIVFDIIQIVLIVIGAVFIIKGIIKLAKYYNIDKIIYFVIKNELPKKNNKEKRN